MSPTSFNPAADGDTNETGGVSEELILGFAAHSLAEGNFKEFEQSISSNDPGLTEAIRGWSNVIGELNLAMPPLTPNEGILASLLARIGSKNETPGSLDTNFESTGLGFAADSVPTESTISAKESNEQQLIIRRATDPGWRSAGTPGAKIRFLNFDRRQGRATYLLKIEAGASYPEHHHDSDEECYVISGDISDGQLRFATGDYFLASANSNHGTLTTIEGCVCLIATAIPIKT